MIYPVKLSGHTMTPAGQIVPISMSLSWKVDGLSTCQMTLDANNGIQLALGDWVLITAPMGNMSGVFYVKNLQTNYINGQVQVQLEHTFGLLQEQIAFGEITPETIGGTGTTSVTTTAAITYLLNQQVTSLWTLYQNDFSSVSQGWKFTHQDIYNALHNIIDSIPDCQWEFDQSVLPWKLSLKAFPTATTMEMRKNRNIESMKVTIDRSNMYTRVYPTGNKNLHIDSVNSGSSYLQENTATWGVISKVITDSSIDNASLLKSWAAAELHRHSTPSVSVTVGGLELSAATGESLDALKIGRLCRIPLPDYNTTVTERIVELSWRDCILSEEQVTVTLANELRTIQGVLYEITRGGSSGGRKANISKDCDLHDVQEGIETFENSDLWINQNSIWAVCGAYDVYTDSGGTKHLVVKDGAALSIERNHTEYGLYYEGNLTAGVIVDRLNNNGTTTAKIKASLITLDGQAVANSLETQTVDVQELHAADQLSIEAAHGFIYNTQVVDWHDLYVDNVWQCEFLGYAETDSVNISIADTAIYRAGVSAAGALTASWSGADVDHQYNDTYTVRSGTNQLQSVTVSMRNGGWTGISAGHAGTCTLYATAGGEDRAQYLITGSDPYQQGYIDGGGGSGGTVTGSWNGKTYTATNGSSSVSTTISLVQGSWSSNQKTIYIRADGVNIDSSTVVDATSVFNSVDFDAFTFEGSTHITTNRKMYANITNGKQKVLENQLLLDYNSQTQDGWFGSAPNYQKYVFWRTAPEGTTSWSSRMRGTINGSWVYNKGYSNGYSDGESDASSVSKNDITVSDDSTAWGVSSQPNADVRTFALSGRTVNANGSWYRFKVTVKGVTKTYCFKTVAS